MEKFDSSDSNYKSVEDLPQEVHDRFESVDGGFVRKGALTLKEAQKEAGQLAQEPQPTLLQKMLFAYGGSPDWSHPTTSWLKDDDSFLGTFLTDLWKNEAEKFGEKLSDSAILESRELYRASVSNWIERQIDLARMEAFSEQQKKLQAIGHTGYLIRNAVGDIGPDRPANYGLRQHDITNSLVVEGKIDNDYVDFVRSKKDHYNGGVRIGDGYISYTGKVNHEIELSPEEARELYDVYADIALSPAIFDEEAKRASEHLLASFDDKTIDEDVKKRYEQFRSSRTSAEKKSEIKEAADREARIKAGREILRKEAEQAQWDQEKQEEKQKEVERRINTVTSLYPKK